MSLPALLGFGRLLRRRRKPDFLIIGAQRCGTTSLFHYLAGHPRVAVPREKELHFFDLQYQKGFRWYVDCFAGTDTRKSARRAIRGEATPEYIFHPHAIPRIKADLPKVKLIALLRNPVDRAYSQYWHEVRLGYEPLSFEEAIAREPARLAGELERAEIDAHYNGRAMIHHSYLLRGIYADQLMRVFRHFPRSQVMLLRSEDLFADPQDVFGQVTDFLGLERQAIADPRNMTAVTEGTRDVRPPPIPTAVRHRLAGHFRAHNQRLYTLVGLDFGWEEAG